MFPYTDPTGTGFLAQAGALDGFRAVVESHYDRAARELRSAFTWLEAFGALSGGAQPQTLTVGWRAFPLTANAPNLVIDNERFRFQDEYVEWKTERAPDGRVARVTFTTEFPEYYEALAAVGMASLVQEIQQLIPAANPTAQDLFGTNAAPASPRERVARFRGQRSRNPWNNGEKGILCLTVGVNSMEALFELVKECAKPRADIPPASVCGTTACVPERASDPAVCLAAQDAARADQVLSLADPVGIQILDLSGIWRVDGQDIAINDPARNRGVWQVSRNSRRAVLTVPPNLTLDGSPIQTGAQVAAVLRVGAAVVAAPADLAPSWALTGHESLGGRRLHA